MTEVDQNPFHVYSAVAGGTNSDDWLNIGLAVPHKDGRGYDVMLHALPLNPRLMLRDAGDERYVSADMAAETAAQEPASLRAKVDNYERSLIEQCLIEAGGRISEVMRRLDIPRRTLNEKMLRLGIERLRYTARSSRNKDVQLNSQSESVSGL